MSTPSEPSAAAMDRDCQPCDPTAAGTCRDPDPTDPIAAVTHRDPYPYYARLVAERPLYHDPQLGLWVASGAEMVNAVLTSELCRVRPPAEPVPGALAGTAAGEVFRRLVRMNDGSGHPPLKQAVAAVLASVDGRPAIETSRGWALALVDELQPHRDPERLQELVFRLPAYVVASLLGVERHRLAAAARWTGELAAAFAPAASREQAAAGALAAAELRALLRPLMDAAPGPAGGGLLAALGRQVGRGAGGADSGGKRDRDGSDGAADSVLANGIGFLFQAYEATAGLVGNTLVSLARHRDVRARVSADPGRLLGPLVAEVLRHDPPVQNTRRFVASTGTVADREMSAGDGVLVVLAAANRDPARHPEPHRFDLARRDRRPLSFGAGAHACPGQALAATIAEAAVERLLAAGFDPEPFARQVTYRPSANLRIPLFRAISATGSPPVPPPARAPARAAGRASR